MAPDPAYAELGLAPGASEPEVKAAWRRLASQWHPDRNRSASAAGRMQRINLAFEALRSAGFPRAQSRSHAAGPYPSAHEATDAADAADAANPADAADAAEDAPGGPAPPEAPRRTLHRKVRLSLEEAALGCTRVLRGRLRQACAECQGSGQRQPRLACADCAGTGQRRQAGWYGLFSTLLDCAGCQATGHLPRPCVACAGSGRSAVEGYRVTVRLPAGVRSGDELLVDSRRMRPGQSPGDLLIRVQLRDHPIFTLDASGDLRAEVPVNGFAWAAGRPVMVPTLAGLRPLQPEAGRLDYCWPGDGFPASRRGARAALHLRIQPCFAPAWTTDQQILLDQLIVATAAEHRDADPRLRAWQQTVQAWQQAGRGDGAADD